MSLLPVKNLASHHFARESKQLFLLGMPILITQLSEIGIGVTDAIMSGRVSAVDLAAVSMATAIRMPIVLFILGLMNATTVINSNLYGGQKHRAIGSMVQQSLWLALFLGALGFLVIYNVHYLCAFMGINHATQIIAREYLQGLAWGIPAVVLTQALFCFSQGIAYTRPIMVVNLIIFILNIPFNYIFIYGKLGLPAMGGAGCGWATAVTMWISLVLMLFHILRAKPYQPAETFKHWSSPQWQELQKIIRLGFPIGIATVAEIGVFSATTLLIAAMGPVMVAGHQVALNFSSLLLMVPMSLSIALSIRVSQALGAGRSKMEAFHVARTGVLIAAGFAMMNFFLLIIFPEQIAALYSNDKEVQAAAVNLLFYAALFQLSDGIQVCTAGALRGHHDAKIPMYITLSAYWLVGLPIGYTLGLTDWWRSPMGPSGLWIGLLVELTAAAILLVIRLCRLANDNKIPASPLSWSKKGRVTD